MEIEFYPANDFVATNVPAPKPASQCVPSWYRELPPIQEKHIQYNVGGRLEGIGLKACMPFIDAMTSGYIQETWQDISIGEENGVVTYGQEVLPNVLGSRDRVNVKVNPGYKQVEFIWQSQWISKLPKGYSILITHPINRLDLPFTTMTGVVDSDVFYHVNTGSIPVFFHENFTGVIPTGTPMYQIIPIKRDYWQSFTKEFNLAETQKRNFEIRKYIWGGYKNHFRQKKRYS